jgi:choline dehydrogenase-like flavoprotein
MTRSLIVGSGPAAAGVALALEADPTQEITVLDIGHRLDGAHQSVVDRMAGETPDQWSSTDLHTVQAQPEEIGGRGLPQKRSYGSDYPFADVGQLQGVSGIGDVNQLVVSGAYGGLSNVWGSQIMPFTSATFSQWPVTFEEMEHHYRQILTEIPFAGEEDALATRFPLIGEASALPPLAPRSARVLAAFEDHRNELEGMGVTVGRARLALESRQCVRCGLCMTGCPYGLIYSAAQTFDRLRGKKRIEYRDRLLVVEVGEDRSGPFVVARDLDSDTVHRFESDRVYLACGAVGTTRLVLSSLGIFDQDVEMGESAQFVLPMISAGATPDPRQSSEFTLNQFNMVVTLDDEWLDVSQIHFYPHNPAMVDALPGPLRTRWGRPVADQLLRRLTVGLGYLPSWHSPAVRVRVVEPVPGDLPGLVISGDERQALGNTMFRQVARQMVRAAPKLDLWPALPMAFLSAPGKSYHFGGSLPHRTSPGDGALTTDRMGRLDVWSRVHMVDASVFPTVPATTFTLTIMANAHRIATESNQEAG